MLTIKQIVLRAFFLFEIIVFILMYIFGPYGYLVMRKLKQENYHIIEKIKHIQQDANNLEHHIIEWNSTPFYKEKFAREHLQMARENEVIYYDKTPSHNS